METLARICVLFIIAMFLVFGVAGLIVWCVTGTWWNGMMGVLALIVGAVEIRHFKKECLAED